MISAAAESYARTHKKEIIKRFADPAIYPSVPKPFTFYMAGSPGAGKTEFSKGLIKIIESYPVGKTVRIDADDVREIFPQYTGSNSACVQAAATIGVDALFDSVHEHSQNAIVDTTFSHYPKSYANVVRDIRRGRGVIICYLYQDPILAWEFTLRRELKEGRNIPKEVFIESFFNARENVDRIKREFGDKVNLFLAVKNFKNGIDKTFFNVESIEGYIKNEYNRDLLSELLKDKPVC